MKSIISWSKKHKFLLIIELAILIILSIFLIFPPIFNYEIFGNNIPFHYSEEDLVIENEDGSYTISSDNWHTEMNAWSSGNVTLFPGLYEVCIDYEAQDIIEADNYLILSTPTVNNQFDHPHFNSQSKQLKYTFEISGIAEYFSADIHYGGYGSLNIKNISITEKRIGRIGFFLFIFLIIISIDVLLCLYTRANRKTAFVILLLTSAFCSIPFMFDFVLGGHDLKFHLSRIQLIAESLQNGQFPVRIYDTAYNGYGYACPTMYGEILLYLPALFYMLGFPLYRAYQIYMCLVSIGTVFISYFSFSRMTNNSRAAVFGSVLYASSSYRLINMTLRAAVGEYTAMMFFPLISYALWGLISPKCNQKEKMWLPLCVGITGLLHTHIISLFIVGVLMFITCVVYVRRLINKSCIITLIKSLIAFLLVNMWFLIPFINTMMLDLSLNYETNTFNRDLLYPVQLLFGLSPFEGKNVIDGLQGEMPLSIGFPFSLILISTLILCVKHRSTIKNHHEYKLMKFCSMTAVVLLWMSSIYFPWSILQKYVPSVYDLFTKIQYPWRLLSFATVLIAITAVNIFSFLSKQETRTALYFGCAIVLLAFTINAFQIASSANTSGKETVSSYSSSELYMDKLYFINGTDTDNLLNVPIVPDNMNIYDYRKKAGSYYISLQNTSPADSIVILPLGYYPNYIAKDTETGKIFPISMEPNSKAVMITIPAYYVGTLACRFIAPKLWLVSDAISLAIIVIYICYRTLLLCRKPSTTSE